MRIRLLDRTEGIPAVLRNYGAEWQEKRDRNAEIVAAHRAGLSGRQIGERFGITRERARQIVLRATGESIRKVVFAMCRLCGQPYSRTAAAAHRGTPGHRGALVARKAQRDARRVERFYAAMDRSGECWVWLERRYPSGYGWCSRMLGDGSGYAHRVAYVLAVGRIDAGMELDHLCRNRACVNPAHLEPVSHRENIMRSPIAVAAINARKTHCKWGHPFSGDNLVLSGNTRRCRTCSRFRQRATRRRRMAA